MRTRQLLCLFLLSALSFPQIAGASHLRGGEITAERVSCNSLTFRITLTLYVDTQGVQPGGNDNWLEFGDGNRVAVPPLATIQRPDLGRDVGMAVFITEYTYLGFKPSYSIRYSAPFRNEGVVNMTMSEATLFYLETIIFLDVSTCNNYLPKLDVAPVDRACKGVAFMHNPVAYDAIESDSISYEMAISKSGFNEPVLGYKDLTDPGFYANYSQGNENKNGPPTLTLDPVKGDLKWDAPGRLGEYNVAFYIIEWRKDQRGIWRRLSMILRDMQIIVDDCDNNRPDLIIPNDTCVVAGTRLDKTIFGIDPDNDPVKIEVFSEVLNLASSSATYSPRPAVFQPSIPSARLQFTWQTSCAHVKEQYYHVVFKITDNPDADTKLVTFKTWRIKVVAPPPTWDNIQVDLAKRSATLTWDPYTCANATKMQVWRRIDATDYGPAACETGMPGFLGYSLISTVTLNGSGNRFTDTNEGKGLAPGARYCYRLVSIFPDPRGGESYVSRDTCLAPILANAPVITHVTVEKTDSQQGAIRISWYGPFDIDRSKFPGPYQYAVYRGSDFSGPASVRVTPQQPISDTTFVDASIDTETEVYNYRVVLYSNTTSNPLTWTAIDTSAVASSVRLKPAGNNDRILLTWRAEVPWSNASPEYPYHLIYRGGEGTDEKDFVLIDSVSVLASGFRYEDTGRFQNTPLDPEKTYCYRIVTRGSYGNPALEEPFKNYSQAACIKPSHNDGPCTPVLSLLSIDCDALFASAQCLINDYSNKIYWNSSCEQDVRSYNIYAAVGPDDEFSLVASNIRDTAYIDRNLASFARCYRIKAVDVNGIESEWSEMVCNDNCPYFELPNMFSPNGDDCNEYFGAYGPFNPFVREAPESCIPGNDNFMKCLRFVERVSFIVYNRWGKEVYSYKSGGGEGSEYINWDGKNNEGQVLASGVYYYRSDVTFNAIDPVKKHQTYKGWVQLFR